MEGMKGFMEWLTGAWTFELFKLGGSPVTTRWVVVLIFSLFLVFAFSSWISRFLSRRVFPRYGLNTGVSQSIATIVKYAMITIGLVVIVQTSGINLSALGILMGAVGVGIGFGLQNITSNFISGIIILFERPIKVGDRVEINELRGNVVEIWPGPPRSKPTTISR